MLPSMTEPKDAKPPAPTRFDQDWDDDFEIPELTLPPLAEDMPLLIPETIPRTDKSIASESDEMWELLSDVSDDDVIPHYDLNMCRTSGLTVEKVNKHDRIYGTMAATHCLKCCIMACHSWRVLVPWPFEWRLVARAPGKSSSHSRL